MAALAARNRRTALTMGAIVLGMAGLSFASVPLYRLFCQVTGFGGTTQRADQAPATAGERRMTVRFDANVAGTNLPWTFRPVDRQVEVAVGEERLIHYRAANNGATPVTGVATFNVTPNKAGLYFSKVACFCFAQQTLKPGESVDMPVSFFVDPAIVHDRNLDDVRTITLSYTFVRAQGDEEKAIRTSAAGTAGARTE